MKHNYKYLLVLMALISTVAFAGVEVKKSFKEAYTTNANTDFQVSNRFGSIVIENTTSNQITIDVQVKVEASSERKAQEILDRIAVVINKVGNTVSAYTEIENASWRGNVQLDIDYHITMPSHLKTMLEMKYGGVDIDALTGPFRGEVKYGEFNANHLSNEKGGVNYLALSYCDASFMGHIDRLNLEMAYSDCRIMHGEALNVEAKYSDLKLGDVRLINAVLAYSDMDVELTRNIEVEAKYSDLSLEVVLESVEAEAKYSDVDIDVVEPGFSLVSITLAYGDLNLGMDAGAQYRAQLEVAYGDMDVRGITIEERKRASTSSYIKGYVGQANATARLAIDTRYGDVLIR